MSYGGPEALHFYLESIRQNDINVLLDAEMMDAVVGGKCDNGCSKACSSQCKHACATSVTWERNFPESGKHFPECGMEMPNGIRTHQEIPARERRACTQTFACYMAGVSVIPIREICTTYYRILYYLLQKAVLPI